MHTAVLWFGFAGAWLLFAGPVFQASVELRAEDEASNRLHRAADDLPAPPEVSSWWWLLPPVRLVLSSRRSRTLREAVLARLSEEDLALIGRYINIARGWMFVAAGAFLIALKETWELAEHAELATWLYWLLVVVMTLVALGLTGRSAARDPSRRDSRQDSLPPRRRQRPST